MRQIEATPYFENTAEMDSNTLLFREQELRTSLGLAFNIWDHYLSSKKGGWLGLSEDRLLIAFRKGDGIELHQRYRYDHRFWENKNGTRALHHKKRWGVTPFETPKKLAEVLHQSRPPVVAQPGDFGSITLLPTGCEFEAFDWTGVNKNTADRLILDVSTPGNVCFQLISEVRNTAEPLLSDWPHFSNISETLVGERLRHKRNRAQLFQGFTHLIREQVNEPLSMLKSSMFYSY